jgi:hypothetical protein
VRLSQVLFVSDDDARRIESGIWLTEGRNHTFAASFGRAKIDEQHLVFIVLDDFAKRVAASGEIDRRELTLEDRVLQMVAEVAHGLKDLAQPLVIADIVADEEGIPHG